MLNSQKNCEIFPNSLSPNPESETYTNYMSALPQRKILATPICRWHDNGLYMFVHISRRIYRLNLWPASRRPNDVVQHNPANTHSSHLSWQNITAVRINSLCWKLESFIQIKRTMNKMDLKNPEDVGFCPPYADACLSRGSEWISFLQAVPVFAYRVCRGRGRYFFGAGIYLHPP